LYAFDSHSSLQLTSIMAFYWRSIILATLVFSFSTCGQLIGKVGPTTPLSQKSKECNILTYGAKADNATNVAPAIRAAFTQCVLPSPKSRLVVPSGNYLTEENIILTNGTNWAFQLDGLITAYV
jgi:rhamnogalacturonan hydrolase